MFFLEEKYIFLKKQLPAKRLAIAGLSVAYQMTDFPAHGPFPTNFEIERLTGSILVQIR